MINNDRGQSLTGKYVWVIETIYRAGKISFRDLNAKWLAADISRGKEIPKRTFDFQQELLWNGDDMEVLSPLWLRNEMAGKIQRMWNKYKE